jgi:hypothetical protein
MDEDLHYFRYSLKINTAATDDPGSEFQHKAATFLARIQKYDPKAVLRPWKVPNLDAIMQPKKIPRTKDGLSQYFNNYYPKMHATQNYVSIYLGTGLSPKTVMGEMAAWLSATSQTMYLNQLQCTETKSIGFLLYSTLQMSPELLAHDIKEVTGVAVGLRWRAISTGTGKPAADAVKALHVEVDANKATHQAIIAGLYSSTAKTENMPMGIRMRLVPLLQGCKSMHSKEKYNRMRGRQARFLLGVHNTRTSFVSSLNRVSDDLGKQSLRSLILSIKSQVQPTRRIFHTVDPAWNDISQTVFSYFQDMEVEASATASGLYLYLINTFPEYKTGITKCFTGAALEDANDQKWDDINKCVVGFADQELDDLLAMDNDFDLTIIDDPEGLLKRKLQEPVIFDMLSQDSISTFQSIKKPKSSASRANRAPGFNP